MPSSLTLVLNLLSQLTSNEYEGFVFKNPMRPKFEYVTTGRYLLSLVKPRYVYSSKFKEISRVSTILVLVLGLYRIKNAVATSPSLILLLLSLVSNNPEWFVEPHFNCISTSLRDFLISTVNSGLEVPIPYLSKLSDASPKTKALLISAFA